MGSSKLNVVLQQLLNRQALRKRYGGISNRTLNRWLDLIGIDRRPVYGEGFEGEVVKQLDRFFLGTKVLKLSQEEYVEEIVDKDLTLEQYVKQETGLTLEQALEKLKVKNIKDYLNHEDYRIS